MSYQVPLGYVPISSSALRSLGVAYIPILLSEVEQEQRPSGNEDREAIVVGAGLCDGEGERAYTAYAPHYDISGSWHLFLELECSWLNFVVTWLCQIFKPNDSTKKLGQMVSSQVTGNHLKSHWTPLLQKAASSLIVVRTTEHFTETRAKSFTAFA